MKYLASFLEENPPHSFKEGPTKPTKPPVENRNPYTKEPTKPTKPQAQVLAPVPVATSVPEVTSEPASTCAQEPDAQRLRLAHSMGRIFSVFPEARRLKSGLWKIDAGDGDGPQRYDHDNALLLAAQVTGTTSNGYPLEFDAGTAFRQECERLPDPDSDGALAEALVWARNLLGAHACVDEVRHVAGLTLDARRANNPNITEEAPAQEGMKE
jgi:hypothetical protein